MDQYDTPKAEWNMDFAQTMILADLKKDVLALFHSRELEGVYHSLRAIRRELDAKLKPAEQEEVEEDLEKLESLRIDFISNQGDLAFEGKFYLALENYYVKLCRLMKKHGIYYREGEYVGHSALKI